MTEKLRSLSGSGFYKTLSVKLKIDKTDTRRIIDIEAIKIVNNNPVVYLLFATTCFYTPVRQPIKVKCCFALLLLIGRLIKKAC